MRLVSQYRPDTRQLIVRLAIMAVLLGCIYLIVNRLAYVIATSYYDIKDEEHDRAVLSQLTAQHEPQSLDAKIQRKEDILKQLRNETMIRRARSELAPLYEVKGNQQLALAAKYEAKGNIGLAATQKTLAEYSFVQAMQFDPYSPNYCVDLGNLHLTAARAQKDDDHRYDLLRTASWELQRGFDLELDKTKKPQMAAMAAECRLEFAQLELRMPKYRSDAGDDLQRALKLAAPGSSMYAEISQMLKLAD